jgi:hypothetical protein
MSVRAEPVRTSLAWPARSGRQLSFCLLHLTSMPASLVLKIGGYAGKEIPVIGQSGVTPQPKGLEVFVQILLKGYVPRQHVGKASACNEINVA